MFADPDVGSIFAQACSTDAPLRLRLFVGTDAPELHNLRWETLRHPDGRPLLTGERVFFSRYLSSYDWRPVRQRSLNELRALVMIANPANLAADYKLAAVDVEGELDRVRKALDTIPVTALDAGEKASLATLSAKLGEGYDILYLVCHGALIKGEPRLYLENEDGQVACVPGLQLVERLQGLQRPPQLVVLASCQSAGIGDANVGQDKGGRTALGPQLAEAGLPAVLAMHGNVTMETVKGFMPTFFRELRTHGYIDRAVAVARGAVRERADSWMPVLFMRLKSGRLWYTPGFTNDHGMEKWDALIQNIRTEICIPILGPGLNESLLGSYREIARNLARAYRFPMAPQDQDDLPKVAQYLSVSQQKSFPKTKLQERLRKELHKRYSSLQFSVNASLPDLIRVAGESWRKERGSSEPNTVLANMDAPIYITTNWDNLLEEALRESKKEPQSVLCPWWVRDEDKNRSSIFFPPSDYYPSRDKPIVYHLFGRYDQPRSLVLTEDDYFDFLIGTTKNRDLIPPVIREALADRGLLFLGFEMEDWNFRVIYRSIMSQEGSRLNEDYAHIAAQINPEEGRILEPERARHYLEEYF
ncbi:MAG: CHAT domain-containing protein [Synechococcaceae cyanobacterium SM1_2_3]|nr:CHAT domain-containing protein [Synechococcaceae cyanobacterium SM1_2_3]